MTKTLLKYPLAVALLFSAAAAFAETPYDPGKPTSPPMGERENADTPSQAGATESSLGHSDRHFIMKAAKMGQEEVDISRVAAQNASNPQVRDFANQLVTQHEQANAELAELASRKGVALSNETSSLRRWQTKSAQDLDKDYLKTMVSDHEDAIDLFEKAAKSEDADVAAFARKYLPTLQEHYTQAKNLRKQIE